VSKRGASPSFSLYYPFPYKGRGQGIGCFEPDRNVTKWNLPVLVSPTLTASTKIGYKGLLFPVFKAITPKAVIEISSGEMVKNMAVFNKGEWHA
jgi:hypothetical protein